MTIARPLDDLIEDVEWLLECREYPPTIVKRVGYKASRSLVRRLANAGRHDLAQHFYEWEKESRKSRRTPKPEDEQKPRPTFKHGTATGYRLHYRHGEKPCDECRAARGGPGRKQAVCGTTGGYRHHKRFDEPVCDPCREAAAEYDRKRRQEKKQQRTEQVAA